LLPGGIASGIQTAYLSYQGWKGNYNGHPWNVAIEGGYSDTFFSLDEATSSNDLMFMERASPQVIASNVAAGDFRSNFGGRAYGDWFWAGAYVTGPTSGAMHAAQEDPPPIFRRTDCRKRSADMLARPCISEIRSSIRSTSAAISRSCSKRPTIT
jgi:phosphate-selective porin OprO/OprP